MNAPNFDLRFRNRLALIITVFACSAMLGDILGWLPLKGIGAASGAAPFPKVFCKNQGIEGFASEFTITACTGSGSSTNILLTPEIYQQLAGPYNRRNAYGAALAFAPRLPPELWRSVFVYGFGPSGPLRHELGIPTAATNISVTIRSKTIGLSEEWVLTHP